MSVMRVSSAHSIRRLLERFHLQQQRGVKLEVSALKVHGIRDGRERDRIEENDAAFLLENGARGASEARGVDACRVGDGLGGLGEHTLRCLERAGLAEDEERFGGGRDFLLLEGLKRVDDALGDLLVGFGLEGEKVVFALLEDLTNGVTIEVTTSGVVVGSRNVHVDFFFELVIIFFV